VLLAHARIGLVLNVNDNLQRSEVCRSRDEVLDRTGSWRAAMMERGWA
jgi:hypothetical protein